eukprot:6319183-Pyramimonas_sp.AAC.1
MADGIYFSGLSRYQEAPVVGCFSYSRLMPSPFFAQILVVAVLEGVALNFRAIAETLGHSTHSAAAAAAMGPASTAGSDAAPLPPLPFVGG